MSFISAYLLFIAKSATIFILSALFVLLVFALFAKRRNKSTGDEALEVTYLNSLLADDQYTLEFDILTKAEKKKADKNPIKPEKDKARLFVLDFDGDVQATDVDMLRRQITAIIATAKPDSDSVLLRLESAGGVVHGYGLAAAQLARLKTAHIHLTVSVDKVAASGGYMMACVANQIIAAPFAILGSIGVVAQLPNFHRLLKDKQIDIELHTAGKYKRTLTMLGENDDAGREKFVEELNLTHDLFKDHVAQYRPQLNVENIATGETWYGQQALNNQLIDTLSTSDDFIVDAVRNKDVYHISLEQQQGWMEKLKSFFVKQQRLQQRQQHGDQRFLL